MIPTALTLVYRQAFVLVVVLVFVSEFHEFCGLGTSGMSLAFVASTRSIRQLVFASHLKSSMASGLFDHDYCRLDCSTSILKRLSRPVTQHREIAIAAIEMKREDSGCRGCAGGVL